MNPPLAASWRRSARLTAASVAAGGLAFSACGGSPFTSSDSNGGAGAANAASGGASSADGGRAQSGGAGGASDDTGGASDDTGGASASDGGVPASGGSAGTPAWGASSGGASGGSSNGGARAGGAGGARAGGAGGALGVAGLGVGGPGVGGLVGAGGGPSAGFPSTQVLDDFARADDVLGPSWLGATDEFTIRDEQLQDRSDAGGPLLWDKVFGASQEAFATLVSFADQAREINLVMKAQKPETGCELIEVVYAPNAASVAVDFCTNGHWTELPPFQVSLKPGDQLGARATESGQITVYRNGSVITTFSASDFPHQGGGYIGVNALSSADDPATWDDFGGGNAAP